jgi:hypothetical protein
MILIRKRTIILCVAMALHAGLRCLAVEEMSFKVESNLRAAVAKVDITPPPGTPISGHVRDYDGVRTRLYASVLLLDDGATKVAMVTIDLSGSGGEVTDGFRWAVAEAASIPRENIMVAAAHNHSGPAWDKNSGWNQKVLRDVANAVATAVQELRPVTVGYGEDQIDFAINRRKFIEGRSVVRLNPDGPCDNRVKVLRFDDGRSLDPLAVLMHCVCHPCVHTWGDKFTTPYPNGYPKMSADFPGEAKEFIEKVYGGRTTALFLQGCAGDIRPNLPGFPYRCGDEADIRWIGRNLGCAVIRASDRSVVREELARRPATYPIRCATRQVELPAFNAGEKVRCELQAMKIGPYLFLTLPGEPFVEFGFQLEKAVADRAIPVVVGYANGSIGYICTDRAHNEGGYEPNNSKSGPGSEGILITELRRLADKVIGDTFDSFAPPAATANRTEDRK